LISKKSSPVKPLCQMNQNLVGSIYRRQESPVAAMFVTDWDGMINLYRGPSIDASYQFSDHLAKRFQRKRFLEIDQSETRIACGGHVCIQNAFISIQI
jgi:hypothetical protein